MGGFSGAPVPGLAVVRGLIFLTSFGHLFYYGHDHPFFVQTAL